MVEGCRGKCECASETGFEGAMAYPSTRCPHWSASGLIRWRNLSAMLWMFLFLFYLIKRGRKDI